MISFLQIITIGVFSFFMSLAILILSKKINPLIRYSISAAMIGVAFWILSVFLLSHASSTRDILLWSRLVFLGPIAILSGFLIFALAFPRPSLSPKPLRQITSLICALSILLGILLLIDLLWNFSHFSMLKLSRTHIDYGPIYPLLTMFLLTLFVCDATTLFKKLRSASGIEKEQVRYIFWGTALTFVLSSIPNLFLPFFFKNNQFIEYGPFSTIVLMGFTTYAIVQHQLLEIKFVLSRGLIYSLLTTIVIILYGIGISLSERLLKDISDYHSLIITGVITTGLVILFQPLYKFIQSIVDKIFFKGKYDYKKTIKKISEGIQTSSKLDEIQELLLSTVVEAMKVEKASISLLDEKKNHFIKTCEKHYEKKRLFTRSQ